MVLYYATNRLKIGSASGKRADCWFFASDGQPGNNPQRKASGETGLDSLRNQAMAQLYAFASLLLRTLSVIGICTKPLARRTLERASW
jgi:hypothetical protein